MRNIISSNTRVIGLTVVGTAALALLASLISPARYLLPLGSISAIKSDDMKLGPALAYAFDRDVSGSDFVSNLNSNVESNAASDSKPNQPTSGSSSSAAAQNANTQNISIQNHSSSQSDDQNVNVNSTSITIQSSSGSSSSTSSSSINSSDNFNSSSNSHGFSSGVTIQDGQVVSNYLHNY